MAAKAGMDSTPAMTAIRSPHGPGVSAVLRTVFSFPVFMGALLVAATVASTCWAPGVPGSSLVASSDAWWHVAVGERILATHSWPTVDTFSFTAAGQPWMANEWLGEVLMALAVRWGGLQGLALLLLVLVSALMLLLYSYGSLRSGNSKAGMVACLLLLPEATGVFALRPQLLGYVFLAITFVCLERFRQGRRRAFWLLPLVFLLWVNTHGSFAFGFLVLGVYWVSGWLNFRWNNITAVPWSRDERWQMAVVVPLSVLATLVSPYGTRLAVDPIRLALYQPLTPYVSTEWQMAPFDPRLLGLLLAFLLVQVYSFRPGFRMEEVALLLFSLYAAYMHQRFLILLVLAFAPLMALLLAHWLPPYARARDKHVLNAVIMGMVAIGLVAFFPSERQLERAMADYYPVQAVNYLKGHSIPARMLNDERWGGYLIWKLSPLRKDFVDGRWDTFEQGDVLADYVSMERLEPRTPFLLRKYGIEACLLARGTSLDAYFSALPGWQRVYEDRISTVFVGADSAAGGLKPRGSD